MTIFLRTIHHGKHPRRYSGIHQMTYSDPSQRRLLLIRVVTLPVMIPSDPIDHGIVATAGTMAAKTTDHRLAIVMTIILIMATCRWIDRISTTDVCTHPAIGAGDMGRAGAERNVHRSSLPSPAYTHSSLHVVV